MSRLHRSVGSMGPFGIATWRAAPQGEFVDGLVITRRDTTRGDILRVAAFDPAENLTVPDVRALAHYGVSVTASWFSRDIDAVDAVVGANTALHDPTIPGAENPLVTAVWADIRVSDGALVVESAGRAGDGEVAVVRADGRLERLCSIPMLDADAEAAFVEWIRAHRPTPEAMWAVRDQWLGERHHYHNPHLGLFSEAAPELVDVAGVRLDTGDTLIVATDGAELDRVTSVPNLDAHIASIVARRPVADAVLDNDYSHSDIAAVQVWAATPGVQTGVRAAA